MLDILGVTRSSYYARRSPQPVKAHIKRGRPSPGFSEHRDGFRVPDEQIEEYLMEYFHDDDIGGLGYKKWTALIREQYHLIINKKKVYRLCKKLDILKDRRIKKSKHPRRLARNRVITGPNQLWQVDIKYGHIINSNHFVFVCCAIDVYDRQIVGVFRGPTCRAKDITIMLVKAMIKRRIHFKEGVGEKKLIIRTDNGPQFVSDIFGDFCAHQKIYHERIPKKTPDMNAYIESFYSQLQRECFKRHTFTFFEEAYYHIEQYIDFYNKVRPHGSLKDRSPSRFNQLTLEGVIPIQEVKL
ncbi:IS3 family transposase [Alkalibacillus haloalkaliphilus]|uniref:IS3 family transposase n=1 Tax=Alkalibacillus haloalkaliphilus TaxID=94136 RepID=UPI0029367144|nr:IS3 family transposase [Alkalibacillus haloalkaliphilus]MDV2583507.1 IS3 family transposase [Alkalibacillus haloalkaliphilus]